MARAKPTLRVILSSTVIDELHGIWTWSAERYSPLHADKYVGYLKTTIDDLATSYAKGRELAARPDLRYLLIRRKGSGHGHVAVYRFDDKQVHVLHVFHSAQDWQSKILGE